MLKKAHLYTETLRHTRPQQLAYRLRYTLERRLLACPALGKPLYRKYTVPALTNATPPVTKTPPLPIFPPRRTDVTWRDGRPLLTILNQPVELTEQTDWHPPAWGTGPGLQLFHLHYMTWLEALDDEWFVRCIEDWMQNNPPDCPEAPNRSWSSYVIAVRTVVWMQQYAARQTRLPEPTRRAMLLSLNAQLRYLENHLEYDLGGNHLVKNIKALLWAGEFFRSPEARRWSALARRLLARELDEQILPDGMHYERSPAYHLQVLADLLECFARLHDGRLRENLKRTLKKMTAAAAALTHPDGMISLFNDGGLHMAYNPTECINVYRTLTKDDAPQPSAIELPHAGYFGFNHQGTCFLMDCGPVGPDHLPAHGHGDMLSCEWDVDGQRILVDPGVYEYREGTWRDQSRSTRCHNTVTLDDRDQCAFWKSFRLGRRAQPFLHQVHTSASGMMLTGSHNGYAHLPGSPRHIRKVDCSTDSLRIVDTIAGGNGQIARAQLLLHPECKPDRKNGRLIISRGPTKIAVCSPHPFRIESAWWFPDFGVKLPTHRIVLTYGPAPGRGRIWLHVLRQGPKQDR